MQEQCVTFVLSPWPLYSHPSGQLLVTSFSSSLEVLGQLPPSDEKGCLNQWCLWIILNPSLYCFILIIVAVILFQGAGLSSAVVPLQLDASGKVKFDALARMGQSKDKVCYCFPIL